MNTAERAARRYYRKVRSWLPGGKIPAAGRTVSAVCIWLRSKKPHLGTPQEIAAAYVENMETAAVLKGLRSRRRVLFAVCATMLAILISWTVLVTVETARAREADERSHVEIYIE